MPTQTTTAMSEAACLPNPTPVLERTGEGQESKRSFYCGLYDSCLTFAARKGWRSWTCASCSLKDSGKGPSVLQWAQARLPREY